MQFANPALLFGALLLAVPLIIHLLNRRKHKRRPWAAMDYLLKAYRKQRRRLRQENLLLLLLRCLIPVLLALAIARPSLRDDSGTGTLGGGAAHHIFVFDGTYSMGVDLPSGTTPFERAKQLATLMVDGLDRRSGQKVSIVFSGLRPQMPLRQDLNLDRAKERIASLGPPVDAGTELTDALLEVADLIEESEDSESRVYLFTDLQLRAFGDDPFAFDETTDDDAAGDRSTPTSPGRDGDTAADSSLFADSSIDAIRRIQTAGSLTVLDVRGRSPGGSEQRDNLQVTDLRLGVPHAIAKTPIPIHATLLNRTDTARSVQATLEIDGEQPIRDSIQLEAGAQGEITFQATFRELGQRRLRVAIDGDDLSADNTRYRIVTVRDQLRVLFVEGSTETEADLQDATHVRRILDPTGGEGGPTLTPFAIRTTDTVSFLAGRERPSDYDLVVLANVPRLGESISEALATAVRSGDTGLFVMLGDRVDAQSYNLHLHRSGSGPMPMLLLDPILNESGGDRRFRSRIRLPDHPLFADFAEPVYAEIFESLPIYSYYQSELPEAAPAGGDPTDLDGAADRAECVVLATVRDRLDSPLFVTHEFGNGKAMFLTSSISRRPDRWNGFDFEAIAFPLLHQLAHWLALPAIDPFNVEVGSSLTATSRFRPQNLAIVRPERAGQTKEPIGAEAAPLFGGAYSLPIYTRTDFAGFFGYEYSVDLGGGQQFEQLSFAVNPPIDEGDLRYYSHAAAREKLGIETITTDLPSDGEAAIQSTFSNLGPTFLWLTLLFVVAEAAMARWVARRRS